MATAGPEAPEGCGVSSCGGAAALCFEPTSAKKQENWNYVGPGRGAYEKVEQYQFVGPKTGSFEQREVVVKDAWCPGYFVLSVPFILLALVLLLWHFISIPVMPTLPPTPTLITSTPRRDSFDCQTGLETFATSWTKDRQRWCCDNWNRGCAATTTACPKGGTTVEPYNCKTGATWFWSDAQKLWCCSRYQRGCPPTTFAPGPLAPTRVYDCQAGLDNFMVEWSDKKKVWCCTYQNLGCPTASTTRSHDCLAGLANWELEWSTSKKAYCCMHGGFSCDPYDCKRDLASFETSWCTAKKNWCCSNKQLGCPGFIAPQPKCSRRCVLNGEDHSCRSRIIYAATHDFAGRDGACDKAVSAVVSQCPTCSVCSAARAGCVAGPPVVQPQQPLGPTLTPPFRCSRNIATWENSWSKDKKAWCCANSGVACDPFDCTMDVATWQTSWSTQKQSWCCQNKNVGCSPSGGQAQATTAPPYNCARAAATWETSWNTDKKAWCCTHRGLACEPFDCDLDLATWRTSWCSRKKSYCCLNQQKGCER